MSASVSEGRELLPRAVHCGKGKAVNTCLDAFSFALNAEEVDCSTCGLETTRGPHSLVFSSLSFLPRHFSFITLKLEIKEVQYLEE